VPGSTLRLAYEHATRTVLAEAQFSERPSWDKARVRGASRRLRTCLRSRLSWSLRVNGELVGQSVDPMGDDWMRGALGTDGGDHRDLGACQRFNAGADLERLSAGLRGAVRACRALGLLGQRSLTPDIARWGRPSSFEDWEMIARWLDAGVKWVAMNEQTVEVYYSMFARRSDPLRAAGPSGAAPTVPSKN
jgi:hypothetical protein